MYTYQTKIKLHETDAAGLLFFSNQFKMIHDAYEAMLEHVGLGFAELLRKKSYFLPIVHTESDFLSPVFVGDLIEIRVSVIKLGKTSFTLAYNLYNTSQKVIGTARTVHVTTDKKTRKKIPLPDDLRSRLVPFHEEDRAT